MKYQMKHKLKPSITISSLIVQNYSKIHTSLILLDRMILTFFRIKNKIYGFFNRLACKLKGHKFYTQSILGARTKITFCTRAGCCAGAAIKLQQSEAEELYRWSK